MQFTAVRHPAVLVVHHHSGSDVSASWRDRQPVCVTRQAQGQLPQRDCDSVSRSPARRYRSGSVAVVQDVHSSSARDSVRRSRVMTVVMTTAAVEPRQRSATLMKDCEIGLVTGNTTTEQ